MKKTTTTFSRTIVQLSLIILLSTSLNTLLHCQSIQHNHHLCSTEDLTQEEREEYKKFIARSQNYISRGPGSIECLPIHPIIVRDDAGVTYAVPLEEINMSLANINHWCIKAELEFYFIEPTYIDDSDYFDINGLAGNNAELQFVYTLVNPNAVNIVFTQTYNNGSTGSSAPFPGPTSQPWRNLIKMSGAGMAQPAPDFAGGVNLTSVHEMGHFFNLLHPVVGTLNGPNDPNAERVARTGPNANCLTNSDFLCGTQADPGFFYDVNCNGGNTSGLVDDLGVEYVNDPGNIMKSSGFCKILLTDDQLVRMHDGFIERRDFWGYDYNEPPMTVNPPSNLVLSLETGGVRLDWVDNSNNELGFIIERSTTGNPNDFLPLLNGAVIHDVTTYLDETVNPNETYWYKVRPANAGCTTCSNIEEICLGDCPDCLEVEVLELYCNDQGTSDPSDDYWYFDMIVTDNSGNGVFWTTSGDISESGSYNQVKTVYPGGTILSNNTISFTVFDAFNPACSQNVTVDAPPSCSENCELIVKSDIYCKEINSYNYYFVQLDVEVAIDACFMVIRKYDNGLEEILYTGNGPENGIVLGPFSPSEEFVIWVKLCDNTDCLMDFYVKAPPKCENCIDYHINNINCYDNGSSNPNDDYWTFDIYVEGPNNYWVAGNPLNEAGPYNTTKTIWINSFQDFCFELYDEKEECRREVCVEAPEVCSKDCDFEVLYYITPCISQEEEHTFYINLNISSNSISCFTIKKKNIDFTEEVLGNFSPNTSIVLGPFTAAEDFSLWIMECGTFACVRDIYINAPNCNDIKLNTREGNSDGMTPAHFFPNPVSAVLNVQSEKVITSYNIYDNKGALLESRNVDTSNFSIDVSNSKNGLYFIELISINGERIMKKFCKID